MGMGLNDRDGVFCFGQFELHPHSGELRRAGARVALQEQPMQVLIVLLQDAGKLVRREELRQRVWPENTFVEFDQALNTAVKKIRVALGDCAETPRYVETIPKRGYRFIVPVTLKGAGDGTLGPSRPRKQLPDRRRILLGTALLLLCAGLLATRWRPGAGDPGMKPVVLAVLPLEDLSDDSSRAAFCDGLGEELTTQLGHADPAHIAVTSRAAAVSYRQTNKTVSQVAHELGAGYLLTGNVRGDARRLRVSMELIRTGDELRIWGDDFDRETGDALVLERELSADIAQRARTALVAETGRKR
jgi:DNA-binding winged helix-turn-helix (wHTH) protein/TolB-like protein